MALDLPRSPRGSLADRLNYLFAMLRPAPDAVGRGRPGREYYNSEIADRINGPGETSERICRIVGEQVTISGAYIGELRQGKSTDPRLSHLKALAIAFGVPTWYLTGDEPGPSRSRDVERDLERLDHMRRLGVQKVLLRDVLSDSGLSDRSQQAMTAIFQQLLEMEGLSPASDQPEHNT
ncbi:hypothetical protein HC031_19670 [Planosporangium thailandense]|uniref:HTH cro/C1-type domain-containing protein n=1 Tax=Planosporangium thailandense TaxID=765197 RepID=A0ABX0Y195_9ACTN|nr:hypothetical protein [Planosporangium thailandense]NJC71917.1 hypothetical protein [Planosporangium thailandense]